MRLISLLLAAFFLSSCAGGNEQNAVVNSGMPPQHSPVNGDRSSVDPVCGMVRDSTWTDYTVYNSDTIWFCSEGCKKAFTARPAKYIKQ